MQHVLEAQGIKWRDETAGRARESSIMEHGQIVTRKSHVTVTCVTHDTVTDAGVRRACSVVELTYPNTHHKGPLHGE